MIPAEAAHDTISALGDIGMLQFKDLNADRSAFQRTFASQIKRCDEMARQLRFLTDEVEKAGLPVGDRLGDRELEFDELETRLARLEQEVTELNANSERLARSYNELLELQLVLERAGAFFEDARATADAVRQEAPAYTRDSECLSRFFSAACGGGGGGSGGGGGTQVPLASPRPLPAFPFLSPLVVFVYLAPTPRF